MLKGYFLGFLSVCSKCCLLQAFQMIRKKKPIIALTVAAGVDFVFANHCYRVGDKFYLQTNGAPIGLELAGSVSRPFMMRWDKRYLKAVADAGIIMRLYGR